MYRHSPVRNPRSKGIKIKHVLQVLLLVAVCFWLIFQVKRSHDKRKEFDASDNKVSLDTRTQSSDQITKFGRKDLHPKVEETAKEIEIHQEQEDEDEHEENDDTKHEEEEQDDDKIDEGEKDDGGGGGDDEIDENEQEKSDVEIDREEVNIIDEDKEETEENDEKENEGQSQTEEEVSLADHDEDGSAVHTNEAREENYNADDASSAVTHNGRTLGTENEIKNGTLTEDVGQTAKNGTSNISTTIQEKDYESIVTSLNATSSIDSHDNGPPSSTIVDSTEAQNATVSGEQAGNSSVTTSIDGQVVSNATVDEITQSSSDSTDISEDNSSDPSKTEAVTDGGENLETNDVTDQVTEESLDPDEVEASHLEEKEARTDLETLPEIETEGGNSEDTAVE